MIQSISEETKEQIIKAAEARFSQYGYGKTTMAEIAKDCQMSAANLYRYFESKEDIAVEIGNHCTHKKQALLREIVQRKNVSASERLEAMIVEQLRYTYELVSKQPHISEIVESICGTRADVVKIYKEAQRSIWTELLAAANESGEFDLADPEATSEMIQTATIKFCYPPLMLQEGLSIETLEGQARGLAQLIIRGLLPR